MKECLNVKKVILLVFVLVFIIAGCGRMVDTFKTFSIHGLEEFYDFYATAATKELIIREGKIEFARVGDLYVCPYIKEINHDECALFFYVYSLEDSSAEMVKISDVVLSTGNDMVLINDNDHSLSISLSVADKNIQLGLSSIKFEATDTWLFNGNTLHLSFQAVVDKEMHDGKAFSYDIDIIGNKSAVMIT